MAKIIECHANKCIYWDNYTCKNKNGIKLCGDAECMNFKSVEQMKTETNNGSNNNYDT